MKDIGKNKYKIPESLAILIPTQENFEEKKNFLDESENSDVNLDKVFRVNVL